MTVIWVSAPPNNPDMINEAYRRLGNYVSSHVGRRGHNVYIHTQLDTVAAIITYDLNQFDGEEFDLA